MRYVKADSSMRNATAKKKKLPTYHPPARPAIQHRPLSSRFGASSQQRWWSGGILAWSGGHPGSLLVPESRTRW